MFEVLVQFPVGFFIALSGALVPGPLLAYTVAKSSAYGARAGPLAVAGHVLAELAVLSLLALGLGMVLQSQTFQVGLGLLGGVLLIVLGIEGISKLKRSPKPMNMAAARYHPILGGVLFSTVLNPTVVSWWATIGVATLMEAYLVSSLAGVALWLLGHWLADLGWFSFVSLSVARGGRMMGPGGCRVMLLSCAAVLLALGAYFIAKYCLLAM